MWRDDDNENYFNRKTRKRQMLYLNYCTFLSVKNAYVCFDILLLMCAMYKLLLLLYLSKTLSFVEKNLCARAITLSREQKVWRRRNKYVSFYPPFKIQLKKQRNMRTFNWRERSTLKSSQRSPRHFNQHLILKNIHKERLTF